MNDDFCEYAFISGMCAIVLLVIAAPLFKALFSEAIGEMSMFGILISWIVSLFAFWKIDKHYQHRNYAKGIAFKKA